MSHFLFLYSHFVRVLPPFTTLVLRIIKGRPFGCKFLALALKKKGAPVMESTKYVGLDVQRFNEPVGCNARTSANLYSAELGIIGGPQRVLNFVRQQHSLDSTPWSSWVGRFWGRTGCGSECNPGVGEEGPGGAHAPADHLCKRDPPVTPNRRPDFAAKCRRPSSSATSRGPTAVGTEDTDALISLPQWALAIAVV
jgi:hypothetical protein